MNAFRVSFLVSANKLGTIIGLLQNEVTDLKMEQEKITIIPKHVNGTDRRNTPQRSALYDFAVSWVKEQGAGKSFTTTPTGELARALETGNFKASNASPLCSMLSDNGYIRRTSRGMAVTL